MITLKSAFHPVPADSMTARILLAFLATAGLYYVTIMPALIDGLKEGLAFTNRQAGLVGSFNMYGGATGALLMALIVKRVPWRPAAHGMLLALIAIDVVSIFVLHPIALIVVRFVHGAIGGALVGLTYSLFARIPAPDRTFGVLLLVQAGMGGLGVMILPLLVPTFGTPVLFWALILFSAITLLMLQFLPAYPVPPGRAKLTLRLASGNRRPLLFALLSVALFQAANMGLYAFLIGLGRHAGLEVEFISQTLGMSNWVAMLGALLVIFLSTRHGIFLPIITGILINILGTWMFIYSESQLFFVIANCLTAVTWNFGIACLLGMAARFDEHGQTAVWAGFASKIGLASGPMVGSLILADTSYGALVWAALGMLVLGAIAASMPAWSLDRQADVASVAGGAK
ncbi:MAG: MFS transporter [Pseudomonadota bacterium]